MARYAKERGEKRITGEAYLLHLDEKLGLPAGAVHKLCKIAVGRKSIERKECRVLYKGSTEKIVRHGSGNFESVPKQIFLIEDGNINGRKVLAQVFLGMKDRSR